MDGSTDLEHRQGRDKDREDRSPVSVRITHALGVAPGIGGGAPQRCAVDHIGNEEVVYLAGKHVAMFSYETQQHRFIIKQSRTADIIAFAVSANRKYVATAERLLEEKAGSGGSAEVSVWNIGADRGGDESWQPKKVRVLSFAYLGKQPVVTLAFSRDNKHLATATMHPEACIYLWQLEKTPPKPLAMSDSLANTRVSQISISPWNSDMLCTTGTTIFRIWRFCQPNQLKPTAPMAKQPRDYRFTCHTWIDDDRIIVGTMEGDILVVENMELKKVLPAVHAENLPIWCTAWVARGFVCAGDGGHLSLFERTYDQDYFQLSTTRSFQVHDKVRIVDISVAPTEEGIVCLSDTNKLILFNLANVDLLEPDRDGRDQAVFRPLTVGFHSDVVTGVDVCIQKSIIVTSSMDRHVRVWNFMKKRIEVDSQFDEEVMCVGCHPSGLRIIMGFKYRISMYNVLVDDLQFCQDFPVKHCKELRFSQGGHLFAAAVVTKIYIFHTYNFNCVASLTGHQSMVKSLCWTHNDQFILSAGFEGAVIEWRVETMQKTETEHPVQKAVAYSCVRYDEDTQLAAVIGGNKVAELGLQEGWVSLRTLRAGDDTDGKQTKEKEQIKPLADPILLCPGAPRHKPAHTRTHSAECAISPLHKALFVGTPTGHLHVYHWPLREGEAAVTQVAAHDGEVLFVVLSTDERFLFTVGEDKCLFMWDIELLADGKAGADVEKRPRAFPYNVFDEVAYVRQVELDGRADEVRRLAEENESLERTQEQERSRLLAKHRRDRQQKQEDVQHELAVLHKEINQAQRQREVTLKSVAAKQEMQERQHMTAAEKLESHYKGKTEEMLQRFQELKDEKDDMVVRYDNMITMLEKQCAAEEQRLQKDLEGLEERMEAEIEVLRKERTEQKQDLDALLDECEEQFEEEVRDMIEKYKEEEQKKESELSLWRRRKADKMSKEQSHHKQIRKAERECLEEHDRVSKLKQKNKEHEKTNDALRLEIQVRNDNIAASEKKILELKKQTAELEKLKYVLFFKFNELRKEVNPKEEQIAVMRERTEEMQLELQKIRDDRDVLRQALAGKNDKIRVIKKETSGRRRVLDAKERLMRGLLRELSELLAVGQPKTLVYSLRDTVVEYAHKYETEQGSEGRAASHEFHRQRAHMEKRLAAADKQNERRRENLLKDNQRKTSENATLVREVNDLRHEKKHILARTQQVEEQVKEARVALAKLVGQTQAAGAAPGQRAATQSPPRPDSAAAAPPAPGRRPSTAGQAGARQPAKQRLTSAKLREISSLDPVRIAAIIQQVERNNAEMMRQQEEIQRLREFVSHLLARAELEELTPQQQSENDEIRMQLNLPRRSTPASAAPDGQSARAQPDAAAPLPHV
eukprot:TRINITY_DN20120_c0_g1_i1.p1 TRINITY_DN20120_c0_g1~~TRINITY_DN20120_c0_g1_i1.p1  ORF type:complete len:1373 (+),score=591.17 TRINITY_DN20120_c0_g1_i1:104-4222(+)